MVETSLVLLCLLLLIFGVVEGGRLIWCYTTLSHAARHAARYAMVHGTASPATDTQIRNVARYSAKGLTPAGVEVTTSWIPNRELGSQVQVRATYNVPLMLPSLLFARSTFALRSTARATVAQ